MGFGEIGEATIRKTYDDGSMIVYAWNVGCWWPDDPGRNPLGTRGFWKGTTDMHEHIGHRKPDELKEDKKTEIIGDAEGTFIPETLDHKPPFMPTDKDIGDALPKWEPKIPQYKVKYLSHKRIEPDKLERILNDMAQEGYVYQFEIFGNFVFMKG
jgi:hypothetical protein